MKPKRPSCCRLAAVACCLASSAAFGQYEQDIARWTAQDAIAPPAPGGVLFIGSSSIRRWEQLTLDFAGYRVLQRGFGGAKLDDVVRYVDDIVLPYAPSAIVLWAGTNDIAAGSDGQEVIADYAEFVRLVHAERPATEIFYLGIMPTPGRFANGPQERIANDAIAALAGSNPKLHFIDLASAFNELSPPSGQAFLDKFVDRIHLNRAGYDLWTSVIRPRVEAVVTPNKTFAQNPRAPREGDRLLMDFGPSNPDDGDPTAAAEAGGNRWNNWHSAKGGAAVNAGERLTNLVDTKGHPTGVNLIITGGFLTNGKANGGLLDPEPALLGSLAIATATQDYFFSTADGKQGGGNDNVPGGFMLDGLDPNQRYDLRFFGSYRTTERCVTEYAVTGADRQVALLQTSGFRIGKGGYNGNNDRFALVAGVQPDEFGQVFVDLTLSEGSGAYINAMELTVATP
ncbi:MAG: GDSL-type esterase/lipase family protein [Planctomycetota bacterium]